MIYAKCIKTTEAKNLLILSTLFVFTLENLVIRKINTIISTLSEPVKVFVGNL